VVGVVFTLLVLAAFALGLWGWKNKKANNELRNLTQAEVQDFQTGTTSLDPNKPHASIYGLPYNQSKEIPRNDIELGKAR